MVSGTTGEVLVTQLVGEVTAAEAEGDMTVRQVELVVVTETDGDSTGKLEVVEDESD